jgi:hypothetical protein
MATSAMRSVTRRLRPGRKEARTRQARARQAQVQRGRLHLICVERRGRGHGAAGISLDALGGQDGPRCAPSHRARNSGATGPFGIRRRGRANATVRSGNARRPGAGGAQLPARALRSGGAAVRLGLHCRDRERRARHGPADRPALDHHGRPGPGRGGPRAGCRGRAARAGSRRQLSVHLRLPAPDGQRRHGRQLRHGHGGRRAVRGGDPAFSLHLPGAERVVN